MNIENKLENENFEVLVEFGKRGRRRPDRMNVTEPETPGTTIPAGKSVYVKFDDDDRYEEEFKIFIKIARIPNRNGVSGVGFAPGEGRRIMNKVFSFHHLEMTTRGNEINLLAHYYLKNANSDDVNRDKGHIDPTVIHPEEPGGSEEN